MIKYTYVQIKKIISAIFKAVYRKRFVSSERLYTIN